MLVEHFFSKCQNSKRTILIYLGFEQVDNDGSRDYRLPNSGVVMTPPSGTNQYPERYNGGNQEEGKVRILTWQHPRCIKVRVGICDHHIIMVVLVRCSHIIMVMVVVQCIRKKTKLFLFLVYYISHNSFCFVFSSFYVYAGIHLYLCPKDHYQ